MNSQNTDSEQDLDNEIWDGPGQGSAEYAAGPLVRGAGSRSANRERLYKRTSSVPARISEWEKWKESLLGKVDQVRNKLGRGAGCPASIDLMRLKYGPYGGPLPSQRAFHECNSKFKGFSAPVGCIAGESIVDDSGYTIAELHRLNRAPIVDTLLGRIQASVPFIKGTAPLYRVRMRSGNEILVMSEHLFRSRSGWNRLSALRRGDLLLSGVSRLSDFLPMLDSIESIDYVRTDLYYDLHVPIANHYIAHGLVHHNSGKSFALAYEALYLAAISPNCAGVITAPTHVMLKDAAQVAIFDMLNLEGFKAGVHYTYKGSGDTNYITFASGDPNFDSTGGLSTPSRIYFRTASHPDRLRGTNIAWFGMDEMTYSDEEAWKILVARIRDPKATQHNGFGCWTPKGFDWVWRTLIENDPSDTTVIYAQPRENKYLESDYYDTLYSQYDAEWAAQEAEGKYLDVYKGQVYYSFSRKDNIRDVNYIPDLPINWSLDFNVNPFCTTLTQYVDGPALGSSKGQLLKPWSEIWVFDEIVLQSANTYRMCEAFLQRTKNLIGRQRLKVNIHGDASGAADHTSSHSSDWQIIKDFFLEHRDMYSVSWYVPRSNPPVRTRVNALNAALCDANGVRRVLINPRCKILINDLQSVTWRKGSEGTDMDEGPKRELTHATDALGYVVCQMSEFIDRMDYIRTRMSGF